MAEGQQPAATPDGTVVRATGKDGPQRIKSSGRRWSEAAEKRFLDALSASCNVTHALAAAGFCHSAVYKRRRRDPAFAARWQAALTQGYERLETLLLQRATEALDGYAPDPDTPMPKVSFADALHLLKHHHATVTGGVAKGRKRARILPIEEVKSSILARLQAIEVARRAAGEPPYQPPEQRGVDDA